MITITFFVNKKERTKKKDFYQTQFCFSLLKNEETRNKKSSSSEVVFIRVIL